MTRRRREGFHSQEEIRNGRNSCDEEGKRRVSQRGGDKGREV